MSRKRVAVLISGRGSNLQALIDAEQDAYEIASVISNVPDAGGLERARDSGMGVRDIEAVQALASGIGLRCIEDVAMPANNVCLVWRRG